MWKPDSNAPILANTKKGKTMKLSKFTILDISGVKRIPLSGEYSAESLLETFIKKWIPYCEGRKKGSGLEMTHFPLMLACC